jgi:uncharacterized protein
MSRESVPAGAHYPGTAPIDAYGNGGFRFAGMSHRGSLLVLPGGIHAWPDPALTEASLAPVMAKGGEIDVLLVGTGPTLVPIPRALRDKLREAKIIAEPMSTGAAVRTFNVLLAEGRRVAAALMAVD